VELNLKEMKKALMIAYERKAKQITSFNK